MTRFPFSFFPILSATVLLSGCGFKGEQADLVLHNGLVLTLDESGTEAQALAVRDGRVLEVGAERAILNRYAADRQVDLIERAVQVAE